MKFVVSAALLLLLPVVLFANIPGGGTGTGPNVGLVDNGSTVTISNGIVSIVITKSDASIHTINYTFNNTGTTQTLNLLSGGNNGGQLYWTGNPASFGNMSFTESVVTNSTNHVEIALLSSTATNGTMEIHYSMLRGSPGFYTSVILNHRPQDTSIGIVLRPNIYAGSIFNWMSVDAARNRLMEVSGGASIGVQGAPKECYLWTNGIYAGQYEDKYKYSAMLGSTHAWGWSSVGTGGKNVGIWNISASVECYPGGPMERSLMEHIGTTILNVFTGGYYGLATDNNILPGESWSKTYGPYFYYCNAVTNTITGTNAPAQALYADALAQAAAEQTAWPYGWFSNTNYAPASKRGTVTGKLVINDSGNPKASAAGLWVGLVQQPSTIYDTDYDFQEWCRPYEFWVQADTNGNFTIPDVIAGTNYTLYAFGPGAEGTYMSQAQTGGNPPLLYNVPASPFSVTVAANATNSLGTITWTPSRVGATVFEIGYPDRTAAKFRHGDDYWVGDIGPSPTTPSPIWSKWLEYPLDFPNGVNYVVGQSRWTTDWNFCQPVVTDSQGNYNTSASTISFNLPSAPTNNATASLYLGLCSDYYAAIIVSVNGVNVANISGLSASPNTSVPSTGYYTAYGSSDTSIREGNNGAFTDERLTFPASALHAGSNTITITFRQIATSYFANHFMYDYIRLEMTGYIPPSPAGVTAFAGNNCNLLCWPVTPGATSYNILRSTTSGSGYASITNGVIGPVCGSGSNNAVYLDTTAVNGTTYYYVVQSVNPTGSSSNSGQSAGTTPSASISTSAPAAPTGLVVSSRAHQSVTLSWNAATNASFYSVFRSTLVNSGGGSSNVLSTIVLANNVTNTTYTDSSPTDGSIYRYYVTATGTAGSSTNSSYAVGVALPSAPSAAPGSLTATFVYSSTTNITLTWNAVPGAIGYVISRATSSGGPYTYLQTVTETTYTDYGLNPAVIYYYRIAAMNAAGVSANNIDSVNSQQSFPTNLTAWATNAQVTLAWSSVSNATSYTVKRGTSAGAETVTVVSGYTGLSYTNTGLINGTTYYYVVTATGSGGTSGNSPEVSATPLITGNGIWISAANGLWSGVTNWNSSSIASGNGNTADFSTLGLSSNVTVTLDSARTVSELDFADLSGSFNWTLSSTNTLTLGTSPLIDVINDSATINTPLAGTNGLTKSGAGTLTLTASNTISGGATVSGGSLTLDFTAANAPTSNIIPSANTLSLGASLQINGNTNGATSQSFASTSLGAGTSIVSATNFATVNLGGITPSAGSLVEFMGSATIGIGGSTVVSNANITTTAGGNSAFVGGNGSVFFDANFATVGLYDFAATVGLASPYSVIGGSQIAGFYTTASGTAGTFGNLDVIGNITGWSGQPYLTSMRFNTNSGANIAVASYSVLTLSDILLTPNVGAYNVTFNSGSFRPAGGSTSYGGPLVVWQNNTSGQLILNTSLGNSKTGSAAYVQAGLGTVSITGTSSGYTGQSYLNGGFTLVAGNGSIGSSSTAAALNLNGGTLVANASFALDNAGASLRPVNILGNGGALAATAGHTLVVDGLIGSAAGAGPLTIGIAAFSANNYTLGLLPGTGPGTANATPVYATGTVVLTNANYYTGGTVLQSGTLNINGIYALGGANYGGLTFNGGTLQYAATINNGSADLTSIGTAGVTIASGGGTIDLNGNALTYTGSIGNNGSGSLLVKSSLSGGSLNLQGANTYSGTTTVTNAVLMVNNLTGSATGSGNVIVQNAATLEGNGSINGSVLLNSGATLMPGGFNSLTIGGDLTLSSGSTTSMQIQHAALASGSINITGTITEGGTLIVTNAGTNAFASGDSFQLFNANTYAGSFTSIILPTLGNGLAWNTSELNVSGTLWVTATNSPTITSSAITADGLVLNGTGGTPNWNFYILSTTNLSLPINQWTLIATNQFDASGNFSITNAIDPAAPQTFYRLMAQ